MCLDGHIYIEDGEPYLFFCHEWVECGDGEILVAKLNKKLTKIKENPKLLFKASEAPWSIPFSYQNYVTDGPFVTKNKQTYQLIWSSFSKNGYALGVAYSENIYGPWQHKEKPLYDNDGGHGMIFPLFDIPKIILHSPNSNEERAILIDVND
jgi:beta-xylosidase